MSTDGRREGAGAIEDEAAAWVARLDRDHWSEADEAALQAWLAGDRRRQGALLQAQAAWIMLDPKKTAAPAHEPGMTRRRLLVGGGMALVASFAGGFVLLNPRQRYTTDIGEIRRVPLSDGSVAAINTDSQVAVVIEEKVRAIHLEKGEAWFRVAHDATRPFVVEAGRVRVRAIGTAFSVRRRDRGTDVIVSEGVVETWTEGMEHRRIRLAAGARAHVADNAAIETPPPSPEDVKRALAWRDGYIDLVETPLEEAVAEFNRHNRRRIVIADPAIAHEPLDGIFRTNDPEGFAITVQHTLRVTVDLTPGEDIHIGRGKA